MLAVCGPDSEGLMRDVPGDERDEGFIVQPCGCIPEVRQKPAELVRVSSSSPKKNRAR